jgi:hypothetical protein
MGTSSSSRRKRLWGKIWAGSYLKQCPAKTHMGRKQYQLLGLGVKAFTVYDVAKIILGKIRFGKSTVCGGWRIPEVMW